jgi:hypothetical protein
MCYVRVYLGAKQKVGLCSDDRAYDLFNKRCIGMQSAALARAARAAT